MEPREHKFLLIVEDHKCNQIVELAGMDIAYASLKASPVLRQIGRENIVRAFIVPQSSCSLLQFPVDS